MKGNKSPSELPNCMLVNISEGYIIKVPSSNGASNISLEGMG